MLTLTTTEPRAQIENPTSKLTSHRLKTMCFLTETLTVRITPDGRQVHHLETRIQSEQEQTDRFHSHNASEAFCQSFLSLKAAGLYLRNSCGAQPESALIHTNKAQSQHMQAYQILKKTNDMSKNDFSFPLWDPRSSFCGSRGGGRAAHAINEQNPHGHLFGQVRWLRGARRWASPIQHRRRRHHGDTGQMVTGGVRINQ